MSSGSFLDALGDKSVSDEDLEQLAADLLPFTVKPHSLDLMLGLPQGWGLPLCGAPGKIKAVDRDLADQAEAEGIVSVNPALLEADWLARGLRSTTSRHASSQ